MNVLHVAEVVKGGVATVINELAYSQLIDKDVVTVNFLVPDSQRSELNINDEYIYTFKRTGRDFRSFFSLAKKFLYVLKKERPQVIHLHSTFAGFLCRIILFLQFKYKPKVIYCPHAFSFMMVSNKLRKYFYQFIEKVLSSNTDAIICVSYFELNQAVQAGINKNKLLVIYNGVSKLHSKPINDIIEERTKHVIKNILFVGRFDYQKGFDRLLSIIDELASSRCKNIHFKIIGDYVSEEKKEYIKYSNVTYTGWIPQSSISSYLLSSDFLIIPSRWEGLAMVPLESFSCALPVIASSCSSFPEIVQDGHNGFLVDMDDSHSVANLLLSLSDESSSHLVKRLSVNAFDTYINRFSSNKMSSEVKALYSRLL